MLPKGVHVVKKKDGTVYRYAWRNGGPRLLSEPGTPDFAIEYGAALQSRRDVDGETLYDLVGQYLVSPAYAKLAKKVRAYRSKYLDEIRVKFRTMTIAALEDKGVRAIFIDWRDEFADIPKGADLRMETLSAVLSHAIMRGKLSTNNATGIPGLYKNDRSDVIWTDAEVEALKAVSTPALANAIDFARFTGLRQGDCIAITWDADKGTHLDWVTSKTGKRVMVPILQELRKMMDALPRTADTILACTAGEQWNANGQSWKSPAIGNAMQRAKKAAVKADEKRAEETGSKLQFPDLLAKRFHDFRGTFATYLCERGVSDERIADIVGWSRNRIAEIRRVYVSNDAIMADVLRQLSVNATVNSKDETPETPIESENKWSE